jgi:hypothetical protein
MWCIDHGATLLFQHSWPGVDAWAGRAYDPAEHVLGDFAAGLGAADAALAPRIDATLLDEIIALVPPAWLAVPPDGPAPAAAYREHLLARLHRRPWMDRAAA